MNAIRALTAVELHLTRLRCACRGLDCLPEIGLAFRWVLQRARTMAPSIDVMSLFWSCELVEPGVGVVANDRSRPSRLIGLSHRQSSRRTTRHHVPLISGVELSHRIKDRLPDLDEGRIRASLASSATFPRS